ncbi:hypothetical protein H8S75_20125 [Hungatella sp. L12]|uniref:DUF4829 domain-containing protein n=1 Tax=Hungatella hominis TaxID=2763050 RepID=A0ABR7HAU0_9FIRM|nr:hypothetical protein [Hungatella hominis]MBC5710260.1 hypothetical protein [Hungatella hominis]
MKDLLENLKKRLADEETIRYLKFMVIPLVVIILIIVIVVADRPQGEEGESTEDVSQIEIGTAEATEEKTGDTEDTAYHLEEAGEEIRSLMEAYFKARRTCDINGLAEVYGDSASPEELREEGLRMEEEVKYYQSYNDIACYSVNGPEENTLVVYTRFQIKFRQSDTMAPSLFACFVKRGADGSWHMMAEVTPEDGAYMAKVNESEAVQSMAEEVNVGLRAALETDSNLLAVYQALMSGEEAEGVGENGESRETGESVQSEGADGGDEGEASENEVTVNGDEMSGNE